MVDPPSEKLQTVGLQTLDTDPSIGETALLFMMSKRLAKLRDGKAANICNISTELVKAGSGAMVRVLHAVLMLYGI